MVPCLAIFVPAFDIKQMFTSYCKSDCLQRNVGCSYSLMHTHKKKPYQEGACASSLMWFVRGRTFTGVVSGYWAAEPGRASKSRCPIKLHYDFISWETPGSTISSFKNLFSHQGNLNFLSFLSFSYSFMSLKTNAIGHLLISQLGCL